MSDNKITNILASCNIDTIVGKFDKQFALLGGRKKEIKQEIMTVGQLIYSDLSARLSKDPAVHNNVDFVLRDNAFRALLLYRISHALWSPQHIRYTEAEAHNARCVSLGLHNFAKRYLIEIHPGANIGQGLYLDHGLGTRVHNGVVIGENCGILDGILVGDVLSVLIGEQASIGDYCTIENEVLCGAYIKRSSFVVDIERKRGRRHPVIGNNCFLCRGVKVLGPFTVADNSFVPIGTVVINDYPKPQ